MFDSVCELVAETICNIVGVVVILFLNVMEVLSVGGGVLLDGPCMVFQKCGCCTCDPSVHLDVPSIGFIYVCVCRK